MQWLQEIELWLDTIPTDQIGGQQETWSGNHGNTNSQKASITTQNYGWILSKFTKFGGQETWSSDYGNTDLQKATIPIQQYQLEWLVRRNHDTD